MPNQVDNIPNSVELKTAAPQLYKTLHSMLTDAELNTCVLAYALGVEQGSLTEYGVIRPKAASFNPRPARILSIIFKAGHTADLNLITAVFLSGVQKLTVPNKLELAAKIALTEYELFHAFLNGSGLAKTITEPDILLLFLADCLDFIRHLHMSNNTEQQRAIYHKSVANLLNLALTCPTSQSIMQLIKFWYENQNSYRKNTAKKLAI